MVMRGIALKLASITVFVSMAVLVKFASATVPPFEAAFFRSLFAIPVVGGYLAVTGRLRAGVRVNSVQAHVWRGLIGSFGMMMGFAALALLPLPDATAIGYAAPLLVVIFSAMFLDEPVRIFRFTAVFAGLLGVLIVLAPKLSLMHGDPSERELLGAVAALGGAGIAALVQLYMRKLVRTESTTSIVFWFSVTSTLMTLATLPFGWVMPAPAAFVALVGAGLCGGLGQVFLTASYRYASPAVLAPFEYSSMVLALIAGIVFFAEFPTKTTMLGASIIIVAGLAIIWRERKLGLEESRLRKPTQM